MRIIVAALIALTVAIGLMASASAFDPRTFFEQQQEEQGGGAN